MTGTVPTWPATSDPDAVVALLEQRAPLVGYERCRALHDELAEVAEGRAVVVQGGDCAEMFTDMSAASTRRKAEQLIALGAALTASTGRRAVHIGRIAGQFAKPRSHATEPGPDGEPLPVYRGDAVNALTPTIESRTADPWRMLTAYDLAADVLAALPGDVYASHEMLLADYEQPLIRHDAATGARYGTSGHLLWAGHRTRDPYGPQISMLAGIANPVAVKLGPGLTPADLAVLIDRLDPARTPGRLTLIARFGADDIRRKLPALAETVRRSGARPVWLSDPMHGNTVRTRDGRKTRVVDDMADEVTGFAEVLLAAGSHPGGLHLELSPDDVTECVATRAEVATAALPRYRTACDPRLNPAQARTLLSAYAAAVPDESEEIVHA
ncbi:phenazine biosynthesis protein PhzC [Winogradskya consettensis]|uniref:Phospho-2-dehydro-3-deoxyheptonate aldolase n=1 Tax=Winogradskya consettensis TaxID=113560 RepID=A0A919T042_9ACTN|nr:3-deoxy-7-phosphoheptulonate synthase [Actinoplanes consettensis]GIM82298.1 phospho-2-dehydro-3-deoxyheptonate aldolase [Actinoplanes consettensis]